MGVSLSSTQLDAFYELSRLKRFSAAAKRLSVTQSALSQRISNLEAELGATLFIREPSGVRLTTIGEELLQYCKNRDGLEKECISRIKSSHAGTMSGVVRIGAYSTIMRSIILPSMADFSRLHSELRFEMTSRELRTLPMMLRSGEVDFIFLDRALKRDRVETRLLGYEQYVLVESKLVETKGDVYLDHDAEDETTSRFLEAQKIRPSDMTRSFLDDIYAIIDGVALGLGRAVVPLHLVQKDKRLKRVAQFTALLIPVYLNYFRQSVYTSLQKELIRLLEEQPKQFLLLPVFKGEPETGLMS